MRGQNPLYGLRDLSELTRSESIDKEDLIFRENLDLLKNDIEDVSRIDKEHPLVSLLNVGHPIELIVDQVWEAKQEGSLLGQQPDGVNPLPVAMVDLSDPEARVVLLGWSDSAGRLVKEAEFALAGLLAGGISYSIEEWLDSLD
jgi:hypothetical protein